ncbi:MAG: proteasome accessory factor PafA2 family protein [Verrucomicrobia bacterium]|nr:proteasome accessory factor PafA2 family protein [Verrucomicrobiota bacterium]
MNRIVGIETEYGCLVADEKAPHGADAWPGVVKNYLFNKAAAGAIDLHYRDYEEPPRNGGFLLNGGRLYLDMGHLEYSSPECLDLLDMVAYDLAGDHLLQSALQSLGATEQVAFLKNNIDHYTGATFGCHENYLMKREAQFTPQVVGALISFLATRQIFTGAGRVGQAHPLAFDFELPRPSLAPVDFQLSQRADHIVNDIYQWVQFNRAIINARDEPLADYRKYRRLHLLIGDSNMSPFATALKVGTTAAVLTLLEDGHIPADVILEDAVQATREISRDPTQQWLVRLENGRTADALDVQCRFLELAQKHLSGSDEETDWLLAQWQFTLGAIRAKPEALLGGVDWISKKWLLEAFRAEENLGWQDPWLQSLDLEYHNINPAKGLFFALEAGKSIGEFNARALAAREAAASAPPANTRARGRSAAVRHFQQSGQGSYIINWDSVSCENQAHLAMSDPFHNYEKQVQKFLQRV